MIKIYSVVSYKIEKLRYFFCFSVFLHIALYLLLPEVVENFLRVVFGSCEVFFGHCCHSSIVGTFFSVFGYLIESALEFAFYVVQIFQVVSVLVMEVAAENVRVLRVAQFFSFFVHFFVV